MNIVNIQFEIEDITGIDEQYHRLIMFDPAPLYERLYSYTANYERRQFSHYKRFNSLDMAVLFPTIKKGICACGCGRELQGKYRRWHSQECSKFALSVFHIICGKSDIIRDYLRGIKGGYICSSCGINENTAHDLYYKPTKSGIVNSCIHLDHIIPVHKGGGGCWLSNYQFLCVGCHREKTIMDKTFLK